MLIEVIEEFSPPIAGRLVELGGVGLLLPLEVCAAHDYRVLKRSTTGIINAVSAGMT